MNFNGQEYIYFASDFKTFFDIGKLTEICHFQNTSKTLQPVSKTYKDIGVMYETSEKRPSSFSHDIQCHDYKLKGVQEVENVKL